MPRRHPSDRPRRARRRPLPLEEGHLLAHQDLLRGLRWHGIDDSDRDDEPADHAVTWEEIPTVDVGWPRRDDGRWLWPFHSLRHVFATWALHDAPSGHR